MKELIPKSAALVFDIELLGFTVSGDLFGDQSVVRRRVRKGVKWGKRCPDEKDEVRIGFKLSHAGKLITEMEDLTYRIGSEEVRRPATEDYRALCRDDTPAS